MLLVKDFEILSKSQEIKVIGYITSPGEGMNLISQNDEVISLKAQGWNSFNQHPHH